MQFTIFPDSNIIIERAIVIVQCLVSIKKNFPFGHRHLHRHNTSRRNIALCSVCLFANRCLYHKKLHVYNWVNDGMSGWPIHSPLPLPDYVCQVVCLLSSTLKVLLNYFVKLCGNHLVLFDCRLA